MLRDRLGALDAPQSPYGTDTHGSTPIERRAFLVSAAALPAAALTPSSRAVAGRSADVMIANRIEACREEGRRLAALAAQRTAAIAAIDRSLPVPTHLRRDIDDGRPLALKDINRRRQAAGRVLSTGGSDPVLVATARQWNEAAERAEAELGPYEQARDEAKRAAGLDRLDAEIATLAMTKLPQLEAEIASEPAATLHGVLAKLRLATERRRFTGIASVYVAGVVADLERLNERSARA